MRVEAIVELPLLFMYAPVAVPYHSTSGSALASGVSCHCHCLRFDQI